MYNCQSITNRPSFSATFFLHGRSMVGHTFNFMVGYIKTKLLFVFYYIRGATGWAVQSQLTDQKGDLIWVSGADLCTEA